MIDIRSFEKDFKEKNIVNFIKIIVLFHVYKILESIKKSQYTIIQSIEDATILMNQRKIIVQIEWIILIFMIYYIFLIIKTTTSITIGLLTIYKNVGPLVFITIWNIAKILTIYGIIIKEIIYMINKFFIYYNNINDDRNILNFIVASKIHFSLLLIFILPIMIETVAPIIVSTLYDKIVS